MKSLAAFLVVAICIMTALPVYAAKQKPSRCDGITLTSEKFLDMFYAVAMHGDLADVPFIEKTLEIKLSGQTDDYQDKNNHHYKEGSYSSRLVAYTPIDASLDFKNFDEPGTTNSPFGIMRFNVEYGCFSTAIENLENRFNGGFNTGFVSGGGSTKSRYKKLDGVGKNGSVIIIAASYSENDPNKFLYSLVIRQVRHEKK